MMRYASDAGQSLPNELVARVISETLPWTKNLTGKTVVIKYGGAAMVDEALRDEVMADIVLLKIMGMRPVIVHGGGRAISEALARQGLPVEFRDGQRVTTPEAMEVVREVLGGKVNQELVAAINRHGNVAVGVCGSDAGTLVASALDAEHGRVGRVESVGVDYVERIVAADYIPVIATVAQGTDGGFYNLNADVAAGSVAAALHAHKVIFLTDVDGLYADFPDEGSLISSLSMGECQAMLDAGGADAGMIPKLGACIEALRAGVPRAHIINGTTPHSLLLELLTDAGVGTVLHPDEDACGSGSGSGQHPLTAFASRLFENIDDRPTPHDHAQQ